METIFDTIVCFGFPEGLNRTMQYGNEKKSKIKKTKNILFKSYYVVWKP